MPNVFLRIFFVLIFTGLMQGCAAKERETQHYTVRNYIQEKERVDQEIDVSNPVGNWNNAPLAVNPERRMTRKVYVLEVTQKEKEAADVDMDAMPSTDSSASSLSDSDTDSGNSGVVSSGEDIDNPYVAPDVDISDIDDADVSSEAMSSGESVGTVFTDYTVEKDDTLQKISKKFFGSFSKWPKIYEANKDVISNPNFLKPGTKLKIPVPNEK